MLVGSVNFRLFHVHLGDSVDRNGAKLMSVDFWVQLGFKVDC